MLAHMPAEIARKLFNVDEYDRMLEVGILTENDRVELIEGDEVSPLTFPDMILSVSALLGT
jgi:hypothetical protein